MEDPGEVPSSGIGHHRPPSEDEVSSLCKDDSKVPDSCEAGPSGTGNHKVQVLIDSLKEVRDDPLAKELDMQTCYSRSTWHKYVDFVVMSY